MSNNVCFLSLCHSLLCDSVSSVDIPVFDSLPWFSVLSFSFFLNSLCFSVHCKFHTLLKFLWFSSISGSLYNISFLWVLMAGSKADFLHVVREFTWTHKVSWFFSPPSSADDVPVCSDFTTLNAILPMLYLFDYLSYMYVFADMNVCTPHAFLMSWRAEEGIRFLATGVRGGAFLSLQETSLEECHNPQIVTLILELLSILSGLGEILIVRWKLGDRMAFRSHL